MEVKDNCEMLSPLGFFVLIPECGFQGFLFEGHQQKLLTEHHLNQMPQKCKVKLGETDSETKPTNSPLRGSLFTHLVSICASVIKQCFLSFTWNLFIWPSGTSSARGSSHSKDLPQRPQNRSSCISTGTVISLPKEPSRPIILLTGYGKFGLWAPQILNSQ